MAASADQDWKKAAPIATNVNPVGAYTTRGTKYHCSFIGTPMLPVSTTQLMRLYSPSSAAFALTNKSGQSNPGGQTPAPRNARPLLLQLPRHLPDCDHRSPIPICHRHAQQS